MSGGAEVIVSPRIAGVQWSNTVESTLWGMASGVAVVLDVVLGPAEAAPTSCGGRADVLPAPASGMVFYIRRGGVRWALRTRVLHAPAVAVAVAVRAAAPDPLVGVWACTLGGTGDTWRSRTPRGGRSGTPSVCAERPSWKDT